VKYRALVLAFLSALVVGPLLTRAAADDILTADQFFSQVSDHYVQISDYEAKIAITAGKNAPMTGTIIYKTPSLLRIDFISPPDQVIAFDGETLQVYIPSLRAILSQTTTGKSGAGGASLASKEGLAMMRRSYSVAYETGPAAVPLDQGSTEMVVRLNLSRKSVSEGFRTLKLSIAADTKLIRRIEGWTLSGDYFVFDFTGIKLNQKLADTRFIYDSPASANVYGNFLFGTDN
jgi:outer membrane lipoprotein-sorting protein